MELKSQGYTIQTKIQIKPITATYMRDMREYKKLKNYKTEFVVDIVEMYNPNGKREMRHGFILSRGRNEEEGAENAKKELFKQYTKDSAFHFSKFSTKEI